MLPGGWEDGHGATGTEPTETGDHALVLPLLLHSLIIPMYSSSEKQYGEVCSVKLLQSVKKTKARRLRGGKAQ